MERGLCFILVTCRHHRETEVDNGNPDFLEGRLRSLGRSGGSPRLFTMLVTMLVKGRGQGCVGFRHRLVRGAHCLPGAAPVLWLHTPRGARH